MRDWGWIPKRLEGKQTEQLNSRNECAHRLALEEPWVWWPSSSLGEHEVVTQVKNEHGETDKNMNDPQGQPSYKQKAIHY